MTLVDCLSSRRAPGKGWKRFMISYMMMLDDNIGFPPLTHFHGLVGINVTGFFLEVSDITIVIKKVTSFDTVRRPNKSRSNS